MSDYSRLTINNPSVLKRFSHENRFDAAVVQLNLSGDCSVLDYGTGDGYMLSLLSGRSQDSNVVGFEPDPELRQQAIQRGYRVVPNVSELPEASFDRISCLEVFEHLPDNLLKETLAEMRRLLTRDGFCVISVPIETGFSGLAKNIIRLMLHQSHQQMSISLLWRIFWSLPITRQNASYISSHVGFDHKRLGAIFSQEGWVIESRSYSPFPVMRTFINSQVFYRIRPESAN